MTYFPKSAGFYIQIKASQLPGLVVWRKKDKLFMRRTYFYEEHAVPTLASQLIRTEEIKRLSSFPQDFFSGATEKKG
ncbi:hypothetical protein KKE54_05455 [bacterium]|nr:hypothetical protein [bacterium]